MINLILNIQLGLRNLSPLKSYLVLFLAGVIAVFGLAPYFFWPAYMMAILVLFCSLDGVSNKKHPILAGFGRGFIFGFGYFLFGMIWVTKAFLVDAEKFAWLIPFVAVLLPSAVGLFYGIGGAIYIFGRITGPFRILWFTVCFSGLQYFHSTLFTGLPWNLTAYIWKAGGFISQSGSIFGVFGVSFLTIYIFTSLSLITEKNGKYFTFAGLFIFLTMLGFGIFRLQTPVAFYEKPIGIAVGQAGFSQKELFTSGNEIKILEKYLSLLDSDEAQKANIIVWPEGTFPFLTLDQPFVLNAINQKIGNRTLIIGVIRYDATTKEYFNSMAVLKKGANLPIILGIYDKYHLVPFGEYLPLFGFFKQLGISSLVSTGSDFTASDSPKTLVIAKDLTIEPRICYEIIFPSLHRNFAQNAQAIVNISVDAWYGDYLGPDQHYNQARWRAIETGRPLIRSASGGWSGVSDSYGRVIKETKSGGKMIYSMLPKSLNQTIYNKLTEILFGLLVLFSTISAFWFGKRHF